MLSAVLYLMFLFLLNNEMCFLVWQAVILFCFFFCLKLKFQLLVFQLKIYLYINISI